MKKMLILALGFIFAISCVNQKNEVDAKTLMVMHKLIERSHPDTVDKYLDYYAGKYQLPVEFSKLADGKYHGESPYDDYMYKHIVSFTVENSKLSEIEYDEVHEDGHSKKSDSVYNAEMNNNAYGSAPRVTYDNYEKQLLEHQNFKDVDAISGATYSKYRLKYAFWRAVLNGPGKHSSPR